MTTITTLEQLATKILSGSRLALPVDYAGVSMAMMGPILAADINELNLICVPTGGLQADILIGAGRVHSIETSAMTLGEAGGAPCFTRAVQDGSLIIKDATCPAIHAGLLAAQKGTPFQPIRGLIGSDVLKHRDDWQVIQNTLSDSKDPIVIIPPITPDVALFHCPFADIHGNVWIGRRRELAAMAYAARCTIVTTERIAEKSLFDTEQTAAGVLPNIYVDSVAEVKNGTAPYGLWGEYPTQTDALLRYASMAKTQEGFIDYLRETYDLEAIR